MKTLTKADWEAGLKKWGRGEDHEQSCAFCRIFGGYITPSSDCIDNNCPLAVESYDRVAICCGGTWKKWQREETESSALAVHDFIATKYIEWLSKECGKDEERKPKWVKFNTNTWRSDVTTGKWYEITGTDHDLLVFMDNTLFERRVDPKMEQGNVALCYDDEPPVEKKTPKWAKRKNNNSPYDEGRVPAGRWLKYIDKNTVIDIHGQKWYTSEPDLWELSYSESKPVEKCSKCGQEIK